MTKMDSIQKGIERAANAGLTKTYDIALFVMVQLKEDGFLIARRPNLKRSVK